MGKRINRKKENKNVLVAVLKNKRDLNLLLKENWYRIPIAHLPTRPFKYLAFYQPTIFGRQGKQIKYYAKVLNTQTKIRKDLLPSENEHPRASEQYLKIKVAKIKELAKPIKNIIPRRIYFGFITLNQLLKSKNILELYNIPPTEQIVERMLKRAGIKATSQYPTSVKGRRFCLDFAIFCPNKKIAIECDNKKAHRSPSQRLKDKIKDKTLRQAGWTVIRLKEDEIMSNLPSCLARIQKTIKKH